MNKKMNDILLQLGFEPYGELDDKGFASDYRITKFDSFEQDFITYSARLSEDAYSGAPIIKVYQLDEEGEILEYDPIALSTYILSE